MFVAFVAFLALAIALALATTRLASRRKAAAERSFPYLLPPDGPGRPPSWDPATGRPTFMCGAVWSDGKEVGLVRNRTASCSGLVSHFWMTSDGEVYCKCDRCHDPSRWMVPNGRSVARDEAEAMVVAQEVMLS